MPHPNEHPVSRRVFLGRSLAAGLAMPSLGAILAACQGGGNAISGTNVSGQATLGPGGIPLASPEHPVRLPTFADIAPIHEGQSPEPGPLRIYNWGNYISRKVLEEFESRFGVRIEYTPFRGMSEAMSKILSDTVDWDLFFPTIENLAVLVAGRWIRPWTRSYVPNLVDNLWPYFSDPWYDQGAQYSLPYLTWKTGIGYRRDEVAKPPDKYDMPFDIFWDSRNDRKVVVPDAYRETLGMALLKNGGSSLNSTDPIEIASAGDALVTLSDDVDVEVGSGAFQRLAEGTSWVCYSSSGDMYYARWSLSKGVPSDVLGFYYPATGGWEVANDIVVLNKDAESPVLAHLFMDFLMDKRVALLNFGYEGFQPPLAGVTDHELSRVGSLPPTLRDVLIHEEDFAQGQPVVSLTAEADQLYREAWSRFKASV